MFNRNGVAGAVLQTALSLTDSVILFGIVYTTKLYRLNMYLNSQTVKSRELKFWENVHLPSHVTCHVSHITCHNFFLDKVVKLVVWGSVFNGAYPV